jgi:hypothetical protein
MRRHNNPENVKNVSGISLSFDVLWLKNFGILYDYIFNLSVLNRQILASGLVIYSALKNITGKCKIYLIMFRT